MTHFSKPWFPKILDTSSLRSLTQCWSPYPKLVAGTLTVGLATLLAYELYAAGVFPRPRHHPSLWSGLRHYASETYWNFLGYLAFRQLYKDSKNLKSVQEEFLLRQCVKSNASTDYGRLMDFDKCHSVQHFVAAHPVYIERAQRGQRSPCWSTARTLDVRKSVGRSTEVAVATVGHFIHYGLALMSYLLSSTSRRNPLRLTLDLRDDMALSQGELVGPGPLDIRKSSFHYAKRPKSVTPKEDPMRRLHQWLLLALADPDIGSIEATSAEDVLDAFVMLEKHWSDLTPTLRNGGNDVRADPVRAGQVERVLALLGVEDTIRKGLAKRLWPHLSRVFAVATGRSARAAERLRTTYLDGVDLISPFFGGVEGLVGINLWPTKLSPAYCILPRCQFYEFLPVNVFSDGVDTCDKVVGDAALAHQVRKGGEYMLVLTNDGGTYRLRTGDVVRVRDFFNELPVLEFLYRRDQSMRVEPPPQQRSEGPGVAHFYRELSLLQKLEASRAEEIYYKDHAKSFRCFFPTVVATEVNFAQIFKVFETTVYIKFRDYTVAPTSKKEKNDTEGFVVFAEAKSLSAPLQEQPASYAQKLDALLCSRLPPYMRLRESGHLTCLKFFMVPEGTFLEVRQALWKSAYPISWDAVRVPRLLTDQRFAAIFQAAATYL